MTEPARAFQRTSKPPDGEGVRFRTPRGAGAALAVRPEADPWRADRLVTEHSRRTIGAKLSTFA